MAESTCPSCGKKRKHQGGQWVCMNPNCPEYLVGKASTVVKTLRGAAVRTKEILGD